MLQHSRLSRRVDQQNLLSVFVSWEEQLPPHSVLRQLRPA